jgi:hypothetical protein
MTYTQIAAGVAMLAAYSLVVKEMFSLPSPWGESWPYHEGQNWSSPKRRIKTRPSVKHQKTFKP